MDIGLGLPISDPSALIDWARRAEDGPFRTVALLDRLAHANPEPLVTLAAIACATHRIRVQTEVLIAPLHRTALLAKQAATLGAVSGGRFTLGIGLGGFDDDYVVAGVDRRTRGARLDTQMARLHELWADGTVARPAGRRCCSAASHRPFWSGWGAGATASSVRSSRPHRCRVCSAGWPTPGAGPVAPVRRGWWCRSTPRSGRRRSWPTPGPP